MTDFESWLVAREPALHRLALLLAGDEHSAQDLVQTTLAKLYLAWDRLDDRDHVDAYARRILVNEHRTAWRRPWRRREVVTDAPPDRPGPAIEYDGGREVVWEFVASLPPRQRAVIGMRLEEGGSGVAIFDAETGEQLHAFALPREFGFTQVVWEDDEHLLMAATQVHTQALLRTTLDGAIQRASDAAPYDDGGEGGRFGLAPDVLP